jgi:hypothetical protein
MMGSQVDILYSKDRQKPVIDYRRIKSERTENTGKDRRGETDGPENIC